MTTQDAVERPPSPPTSNDGDFGLTALQQHDGLSKRTQPRSIKASPYYELDTNQYGDPSHYQTAASQSYYAQSQQPTFYRHPHTPPTTGYDAGIRTRSGRALGSPLESETPMIVRRSRSPKPKKAPRAAKAGRAKGPALEHPLSILTKDYTIPVKDTEAYVNRSVEQRMAEVEAKNGYIGRPMNSFMLYRSAYADRAKHFQKENNHQVVSQVAGTSWPMESQEVREQYEQWARRERDNHHTAFPDYKFAPNKNGNGKKRKDFDGDDDEGSEYGTPSRGGKRFKQESRSHSSTPFDTGRVVAHPLDHYRQYQPQPHASSYQASNPYGAAPMMPGYDGYGQGYLRQIVIRRNDGTEDVQWVRVPNPEPNQYSSGPPVGLPDGNDLDLLQSQYGMASQMPMQAQALDPRLMQNPGDQFVYEDVDPSYAAQPTAQYVQPHAAPIGYGTPRSTNYHPGAAMFTGPSTSWGQAEQIGSDFDDELREYHYL